MPSTSSVHVDNNILLITNASKFHLPVRAYTGFLDVSIFPFFATSVQLDADFIDFIDSLILYSTLVSAEKFFSVPLKSLVLHWKFINVEF